MRRAGLLIPILALALASAGCVLPEGPPVIVDRRAGKWWSGDGVLMERSPDREWCLVALRSTALAIEQRWIPCRYVHERPDA